MKKIILKSALVCMLAMVLVSCSASHFGSMASSASLSSANFAYVKMDVKGESQAVYILGIGGMKKETLVADAKQKMLAANPLGPNQALANLTVNFKYSYILGLYGTSKCTVTADIVEFR